eukprot:g6789.t1
MNLHKRLEFFGVPAARVGTTLTPKEIVEQKIFQDVKERWGADEDEVVFMEDASQVPDYTGMERSKDLQKSQFTVMRRMVMISKVAVLTLASSGNQGLSVQLALDGPYLPLVKILRAKLAHMRGLVAFAANEKQRWRTERRELKDGPKELKVQVEAEKDKALQRVTRQANHSLAVTLSTGGDVGMEISPEGGVGVCLCLSQGISSGLVRDCRVAAVFAGFLENSSWPTSAYEVFTASWKDMPGTQNQDWVLYSRFADVIQAEEPWPACGDSSQAQGFPGVCLPEGSQLTGRWFGFADSFNGSLPSYGLQLQVFNASRCFASSASEIRNMVGGIKASSGTSAKDLNIALWFVFGNVVSIVFAVFFFLAKYNFEQFSENLEPMRWSSLVFGLWNFRVSSESDRLLWRQSVADQLRLLQAEEKDQESVKSRTTIDQNMLLFKRCSGFCVNIAIIESLGNSFESIGARGLGEWLGASLAPLVVTGAGVVLPPAVELLTQLEAWPRSWQALLNITRFFLGQILTAGLYMAISMELLFDWPLWTGGDLVLQPLVEPCGQYRCKADQAGAEILALVVTEFVMMMIKPFVKARGPVNFLKVFW